MRKSCFTIANIMVALSFAMVAYAQDFNARKGQAERLSSLDGRLDSVSTELSAELDELLYEANRIKACYNAGKMYDPEGTNPDAGGCIVISERDPHVADFAHKSKAGLPDCGSNEVLRSIGTYEFECVDVYKYIPPPQCEPKTLTLRANKDGQTYSCPIKAPYGNMSSALGSTSPVACDAGKYNVSGVLRCLDEDSDGEADWVLSDQKVTQVKFDNCTSISVNLDSKCVANTGDMVHQQSKKITCSSPTHDAEGKATCYDGVISVTEISSYAKYTGVWEVTYESDCEGGEQAVADITCVGGNGLCDPATKPARTPRACVIPVDGACGSTKNTCSSGTYANGREDTTGYYWSCLGENGGATTQCEIKAPSFCTNGASRTFNSGGYSCTVTVDKAPQPKSRESDSYYRLPLMTTYRSCIIQKPDAVVRMQVGATCIGNDVVINDATQQKHYSASDYRSELIASCGDIDAFTCERGKPGDQRVTSSAYKWSCTSDPVHINSNSLSTTYEKYKVGCEMPRTDSCGATRNTCKLGGFADAEDTDTLYRWYCKLPEFDWDRWSDKMVCSLPKENKCFWSIPTVYSTTQERSNKRFEDTGAEKEGSCTHDGAQSTYSEIESRDNGGFPWYGATINWYRQTCECN